MKQNRTLPRLMAALTLLLGLDLIGSVLALYIGGLARREASGSALTPIFTREAVALQLRWVWPVLALWLAVFLAAALTGRLHCAQASPADPPGAARPLRRVTALRWALLALAVILIAAGVWNGGLHDVLVKAVNICTECIGLG